MTEVKHYLEWLKSLEEIKYNNGLTRQLREELGISQTQFAAIINVPPSTLYRWEVGETTPNLNHLGRICAIYMSTGKSSLPLWKRGNEVILCNMIFDKLEDKVK